MPYNIVAVRTAGDTGARLYPVLADNDSAFLVDMEEPDGSNIRRLRAAGLTVFEIKDQQKTLIGRLKDTPLDVYLTDARLIVARAKINTGRIRNGRRGQCLVGHIRYPWLVQVGATARTGIKTHNALRLEIRDHTADGVRVLVLEIILDKRAEAPAIAQQIAQRCARFHLDNDITSGNKHYAAYQAIASTAALVPQRGSYAFHVMPTYYFASPATAYISRADGCSKHTA